MEISAEEKSQSPTNSSHEDKVSSDPENPAPELSSTNGGAKAEHKLSVEEVRDVLQAVASTGKYWHEWDDLKCMLSFQLKQVLLEYPEAKVGDNPEKASIREAFIDLVNRLDEALQSFIEGPPFTLQRFCEILLNARGIYPVLSKLELALEKNLLVTTTLPRSTDAHPKLQPSSPQALERPGEFTEAGGDHHHVNTRSDPVENGEEESSPGVRDEIMTEAEDPEVEHDTAMDTGTIEETVSSEEKIAEPITTAPPIDAAAPQTYAAAAAPPTDDGPAPPPDDTPLSEVPVAAPPIDTPRASPPPDTPRASPPMDARTASPPTDTPRASPPTDGTASHTNAAAPYTGAAAPSTGAAAPSTGAAAVSSAMDTSAATSVSTIADADPRVAG